MKVYKRKQAEDDLHVHELFRRYNSLFLRNLLLLPVLNTTSSGAEGGGREREKLY
jgi:hypothetical protein